MVKNSFETRVSFSDERTSALICFYQIGRNVAFSFGFTGDRRTPRVITYQNLSLQDFTVKS